MADVPAAAIAEESNAQWLLDHVEAIRPDIVGLARLAAVATIVEPELLRRLRLELQPTLDAGTEVDLWFSPLVQLASATALTLRPDVLSLFRRQLVAPNHFDAARDARRIVERAHAKHSAMLRLEEEVVWADIVGDRDGVELGMRRVVATILSDASRAPDVLRWFGQARRRMPAAALEVPSGRQLLAASAMHLDRQIPTGVIGSDAFPVGVDQLGPVSLDTTKVAVDLESGTLRFEQAADDAPTESIMKVPMTTPLVVEARWSTPLGERRSRVVTASPGDAAVLEGAGGEVELRTLNGSRYRVSAREPAPIANPKVGIVILGHIDHGKTTLAAAISKAMHDQRPDINLARAFETIDRVPQVRWGNGVIASIALVEFETESRRYEYADCPGHADYIKALITGAVAVHGAILVVAATDGPMPQTREHVLLARQIGVPAIVVALTKCDIVDDEELVELVELEVRELLSEYEFDGDDAYVARVAALAALNGETPWPDSILELMGAVEAYIPQPPAEVEKPFLMPVEEASMITGRENVVTGLIQRGTVRIGESVDIVGVRNDKQVTTVTGIETSGELRDEARAGETVGLSLRGTKSEDVGRGMVIAEPGSVGAYTAFEAIVYLLNEDEGGTVTPVFDAAGVTFTFPSTEVAGRIALPEGSADLLPGGNGEIIGDLTQPTVIEEGSHFTIRKDERSIAVGVVTKTLTKGSSSLTDEPSIVGDVREEREREARDDRGSDAWERDERERDARVMARVLLADTAEARVRLRSASRSGLFWSAPFAPSLAAWESNKIDVARQMPLEDWNAVSAWFRKLATLEAYAVAARASAPDATQPRVGRNASFVLRDALELSATAAAALEKFTGTTFEDDAVTEDDSA